MFGYACYPHLRPYTPYKLAPRTTECIFLGYPIGTKGYLCLDLATNHLYTSRHVLFNEFKFPFSSLTIHSSPTSSSSLSSDLLWFSNLLYLHSTNQPSILGPYAVTPPSSTTMPIATIFYLHTLLPQSNSDTLSPSASLPSLPSQPVSTSDILPPSLPSLSIPPSDPLPDLPSAQPLTTTVSTNHLPMQTRSKTRIPKPHLKLCYKAVLDYTFTEPPSCKVASQYPKWCEAMDAEFQALQRQQTWSLVPAPPNVNLVGCKWVYKLNLNSDGSISRYKTRLVANGFHQQEEIDFHETFSHVIKPTTVRLVLAIIVNCN